MAWTTINHTCGHTAEVDLRGTNSHGERDRYAARLADQPCRDCRRDSHASDNAEAARVAAETGLPDLTGSANQIAWAQSIRLAALAAVDDAAAGLVAHIADIAARERALPVAVRVLTRVISGITDAGWLINHRSDVAGAAKYWLITDADREEIHRAEVQPQPLDDEPTETTTEEPPAAPQAAISTLREHGWTVAKIAAQCGVHRSTVYRWAAGNRTPNPRNTNALTLLVRS